MTLEKLQERKANLLREQEALLAKLHAYNGALEENQYWQNVAQAFAKEAEEVKEPAKEPAKKQKGAS